MLTASDVFPALVALLFMGAAVGFLMAFEYRAQQRQQAEQHRVTIRRFDALGTVVVGAVRLVDASPAQIRREIDEADAALRADEEKPPAVPPDDAAKGGAS